MASSVTSASRRPALAPRPTNGVNFNGAPSLTSSQKRPREDEGDDASATRVSSKRTRVDYHTSSHMQPSHSHPSNPSNDPLVQPATPKISDANRLRVEPLILRGPTPRDKDPAKEAAIRQAKRTKADKEKVDKQQAKLAKLQAAEQFRTAYRRAFPSWKFYFDGVAPDAVRHATKQIEALGAVVEGFLSNTVTHFIIASRVDKENELPNKSVPIPALPGLPKASSNPQTYDPLERAEQWGCKIWDIVKLESVLERTLDPASLPISKPTLPQRTSSTVVPIHAKTTASNFISRSQFQSILSSRTEKRPSKSSTLAGLLATEKATNSTLERDPYSRRHDYTYFGKQAAWLLIEVVTGESQSVGRLEYKAAKNHSELSNSLNSAKRAEGGGMTLVQEKEYPEYPILFMDPRMRCPFQPYSYKAVMKERVMETRDSKEKKEREEMLRWLRASKRARQNRLLSLREALPTDVEPEDIEQLDETMPSLTALGLHGFVGLDGGFPRGSADVQEQVASGFIRSNADSFASLSTATGVPTTAATSRRTTSLSLSQSGDVGSWAKHFGVGGLVPSFGGVRHAPQVVMNRTAFAADGTSNTEGNGGMETTTLGESAVRPMKRTATTSVTTTKTATTSRQDTDAIVSHVQALRRTQSLVSVKAAKPKDSHKKPDGYCECCREHYESLSEHIEGKKHRKFALDPKRYKELDQLLQRMKRPTKQDQQSTTSRRSEDRSRLHKVIQFSTNPSRSSPDVKAQPYLQPLSIPETGFVSIPDSLASSSSSPVTAAFMSSVNGVAIASVTASVPPSSICMTPIDDSSFQEGETLLIERGQRLSVTIPSNPSTAISTSAPVSAATSALVPTSASSIEPTRRKSNPLPQTPSQNQEGYDRTQSSPRIVLAPPGHYTGQMWTDFEFLHREGAGSLRFKGTPIPDRSTLESLEPQDSSNATDEPTQVQEDGRLHENLRPQPQAQIQSQECAEEELESDGLEIILVPELI